MVWVGLMGKSDTHIDSLLVEHARSEAMLEHEREGLRRERNAITYARSEFMDLATHHKNLLNRFCDINHDNPASINTKLNSFSELMAQAEHSFSDMVDNTDEKLRHLSIRQEDEEQKWRNRMNKAMDNKSGSL